MLAALLGATTITAFPAPAPRSLEAALLARAPRTRQHCEFVVEVNRKGQVTRVRSGRTAHDPNFNAITYGNALQAFIRTPDGRAIAGVYRLTYDYNPADRSVRRGVELLHPGGVNPNAPGAVDQMIHLARSEAARTVRPLGSPKPLPDLQSITGPH